MMNGGMGMGMGGMGGMGSMGGGAGGFQPGPFPTSQPSMMGGQPMMTPGGGMMYSQPQRPPAPANNQVALYQSPQQFMQQQYGQVSGRERERGRDREGEGEKEREERGDKEKCI